jgi:hypothetical protein
MYFLFASSNVSFPVSNYCMYHDNRCFVPAQGPVVDCSDVWNDLVYAFVPHPSTTDILAFFRFNVFEVTLLGFALQGVLPNH